MNPDEKQNKDDFNTGKYKKFHTPQESLSSKYLSDVGLDLALPERIPWTEWLPNGDIILHYSTPDEYNLCKNLKEYR